MRLAQNNKYAEKNFTASNTRCSNANCKTTPRLLISSHKLMVKTSTKGEKSQFGPPSNKTTFAKKSNKIHSNIFYSFSFEKVFCTLKKKLRV